MGTYIRRTVGAEFRQCSKCREVKSRTEFDPHSQTRDGLNSQCKACRYEGSRKWHPKTVVVPLTKDCYCCAKTKSSAEFSPSKRTPDGLHCYCRACSNAKGSQYRKDHPEIVHAQDRVGNQKRKLDGTIFARRKRAEAEGITGHHTKDEWLALLKRFGGCCLNCGSYGTKEHPIECDHIIPLTRGGTNDISNIQPLCRSCNSSKGNTLKGGRFSRSGEKQIRKRRGIQADPVRPVAVTAPLP